MPDGAASRTIEGTTPEEDQMSEPQEREHPVEPAEGAPEPGEDAREPDEREHPQEPAEGREQ